MGTTADFTDSHDLFADTQQVEQYALRRGRRELEVALMSGWLSPRSERYIITWLAREDARRRRREALPRWIAVAGVVGTVALAVAWLV